jgi:hypothetical protein
MPARLACQHPWSSYSLHSFPRPWPEKLNLGKNVNTVPAAQLNQPLIVIRNCWPIYTITIHKTRWLIESFGYCYHFYAGPK